MKLTAAICLVLLTLSSFPVQANAETGAFEKATRIGEGKQRSFFLFSTATGKYIIRHDGLGEVSSNGRRRGFYLKAGMAGRVEQVYFHEYEGDLLLAYEVNDGSSYLLRMNQQTRKTRWLTPLADVGPCSIETDAALCGETMIDLKSGQFRNTDQPAFFFTSFFMCFTDSRISFFSVGS